MCLLRIAFTWVATHISVRRRGDLISHCSQLFVCSDDIPRARIAPGWAYRVIEYKLKPLSCWFCDMTSHRSPQLMCSDDIPRPKSSVYKTSSSSSEKRMITICEECLPSYLAMYVRLCMMPNETLVLVQMPHRMASEQFWCNNSLQKNGNPLPTLNEGGTR